MVEVAVEEMEAVAVVEDVANGNAAETDIC